MAFKSDGTEDYGLKLNPVKNAINDHASSLYSLEEIRSLIAYITNL